MEEEKKEYEVEVEEEGNRGKCAYMPFTVG